MELFGGYAINHSSQTWTSFAQQVKQKTVRQDYLFFIAEYGLPEPNPVGMTAAFIVPLEFFHVSLKRLHISAVYTVPGVRHKGVGRQLVERACEWGLGLGAVEADLNVLVNNPARSLYEQLGFQSHEISMVKKLHREQFQ